ncbi:hypothetical protein DO65_6133 [Burkholderia pseudomallei]|nr:hypothetical protein DO65_6133 [Burkholderia pseudomallei]
MAERPRAVTVVGRPVDDRDDVGGCRGRGGPQVRDRDLAAPVAKRLFVERDAGGKIRRRRARGLRVRGNRSNRRPSGDDARARETRDVAEKRAALATRRRISEDLFHGLLEKLIYCAMKE